MNEMKSDQRSEGGLGLLSKLNNIENTYYSFYPVKICLSWLPLQFKNMPGLDLATNVVS